MTQERKSRILIVEDDLHTRALVERVVQRAGFEVVMAGNGQEASKIVQRDSNFDVIISDWVMPEVDGLELCRILKEDEVLRQIYFIILSSRDMAEDRIAALEAGVDDYFTKPCQPTELLARIRAGIRIRNLQKDLLTLERNVTVLQLATTAGHEINNPLTGLIGFISLLKEGLETGEEAERLLKYVSHMENQAERIRLVIARLVSMTEMKTVPYLGTMKMLDLGLAAQDDSDEIPSANEMGQD